MQCTAEVVPLQQCRYVPAENTGPMAAVGTIPHTTNITIGIYVYWLFLFNICVKALCLTGTIAGNRHNPTGTI